MIAPPAARAAVISLPPPDLFRPLTPEEAVVENQKRAPVARPDQPAVAFKPKFADKSDKDRALECMTQAVYYEAASEPLPGREAVAQVVLNRLHHPAFPNSVCGVVYQGAERSTGCQFSFACDGSLRRPPAQYLWNEARKVAARALAGKVFGPVGHATHYHADYVLPYWADSLDKEVQIGRHIFYRLKAGLGAPRTFNQSYAGRESSPLTPTDAAVAAQAVEAVDVPPPPTSGLEVKDLVPLTPAPPKPTPIAADLSHGQLLADESAGSLFGQVASPGKTRPADASSPVAPCSGTVSTRATPLDNRLGRPKVEACR